MDEGPNSWIWRTRFRRTISHRLDKATMDFNPTPLSVQEENFSKLKSKPSSSTSLSGNHVVGSSSITPPQKPAMSKQISLSPLSEETVIPDSFKEARLEKNPQRSMSERKSSGEIVSNQELKEYKPSFQRASSGTGPLRHLGSMKSSDVPKRRKEPSWGSKYFNHTGVKVMAVEETDEWFADLTELLVGQKFAHGAHSQVHHGIYKGKPVAVKIITIPDNDENGDMAARLENEFNTEVYLLSKVHHQNVIKFIAACRKPPGYFVVMEYLSGGSLRAFLHRLEFEHQTLPLLKIISMALEIARGMRYIHSQGVIHRDLKPENILIDQEFQMKIADFGIACEEANCDALSGDPGTYRWMAPEMFKHKPYGKKVDVYSFGLILSEMISGLLPFEGMPPLLAACAVANKNLRPDIPANCPTAMKALIEQCWSPNPNKRLEFWQIVIVLEKLETSISHDETLKLPLTSIYQRHKKGCLHCFRKLRKVHSATNT